MRDQSCNAEEPKKAREGSSNDPNVSLDDVSTEDLKPSECLHILPNGMKNNEAKIKEICELNQATQDNQIIGECQLRDLVQSIEIYKKKFDKLERKKNK